MTVMQAPREAVPSDAATSSLRQTLRDYYILTKPSIILLLLIMWRDERRAPATP